MRKRGLTIAELLVVMACLGLLGGILAPTVSAVRGLSRRVYCASQLSGIHTAMSAYAADNHFCMPPFKFCDVRGNLPASGHWGGPSQPDPMTFSNPMPINLSCLVTDGLLIPEQLKCPSSAPELRRGQDSFFPYTNQFSTYCLRFPASSGLFEESPALANYHKLGLLGIYLMYAGGQKALASAPGQAGATYQTVPLVRLTRRYKLDSAVAFSTTVFDPAGDAVLSDVFWWQDNSAEAPNAPKGLVSYRTQAGWCHGEYFNVLYGSGAVRAIADDGTVAANSLPPDGALVDSGMYFGKYAERVWQHFDAAR